MSVQALGIPQDRIKRFESDVVTINTTSGNTFFHELGRVPGNVEIRLVCVTANNGWLVYDELPLQSLWRDAGDENDGAPNILVRYRNDSVFVKFGTEVISFFNPTLAITNANKVTFTLAQWKLKVICSDAFPLS